MNTQKINSQKQTNQLIEKLINNNEYKELVKKLKERHNNFLYDTGTQKKEMDVKKNIDDLRNKVYPTLRRLPYHFVINYFKKKEDEDFIKNYFNAILGRETKTAIKFLSQPTYLNFMLYSFTMKRVLPMVGFYDGFIFKNQKKVVQNFDELKIFASRKTKYRSLLGAMAEVKKKVPYIYEFKRTGENEIIGKVISSSREEVPEDLKDKEFKYFRLIEQEEKYKELWEAILFYWEEYEEKKNGNFEKLKDKLKNYPSVLKKITQIENNKLKEGKFNIEVIDTLLNEYKLEEAEKFQDLLNTFKEQFKYVLTEDYIKEKTRKNYDDGLSLYFWTFYFGTIRMILNDNDINYIYFLPIITGKEDKYIGGGVVMNTKYPIDKVHPVNKITWIKQITENMDLPEEKIKKIKDIINNNFNNKPKIGKEEMLRTYQLIFSGYVDDYQMQELNMIDNKIKASETAVAIIANNISHNLGSHALSYIKTDLPNNINNTDYIKHTAKFIGYLQERQEFISMFTMGTTPFYSPVNFYYFINKRFVGENSILMDYIAKSENYDESKINILFKYKIKENTEIEITKENTKNNKFTPPKEVISIEVNLPGGHLGTQAFFSILEQKLRNVAKHQKIEANKIEIEVIIEDTGNEDYYDVTVKDVSGIATEDDLNKIKKSLTSEFLRNPELSKQLGKGMQEMFIMAAWLQGIKPEQLVIGEYDDEEIIQVELIEKHITFHFKISKVKNLLIITEKDRPDELENGVYWKHPNEISDFQDYRLIVLDNELTDKNRLKQFLPVRVLEYDLKKRILSFEEFYEIWIKKLLGENAIDQKILICDTRNVRKQISDQINTDPLIKDKILLRDNDKKSIENIEQVNIIYYRHFYEDQKKEQEQYKNIGDKFLESTSGNNFTHIFVGLPKNYQWYLKTIESALTKIIIFDERLYSNFKSEEKYYKFKHLNICIASIEEKDGKLKILNLNDEIIGQIEDTGEINMNNINQYHLLSIHQGLIDRIYDALKNTGKINDKKEDLTVKVIKSLQTENIRRIIVHSGRSVLPIVPETVAFVPYTSLENALRASKFNLTELLFSTKLNIDKNG